MKTNLSPIGIKGNAPAFFTLFYLVYCGPLIAQIPVAGIYTHWTNATTTTSYGGSSATGSASSGVAAGTYTYKFGLGTAAANNRELLDSFTDKSGNIYHFESITPTVKFRREDNATVTGLRKSLWFSFLGGGVSGTSGTAAILPDYDDSLERIFAGRTFNIGIDNNFQNSSATNNNNVERVDVLFPSGFSATDGTKVGFVVFDRGTSLTHDSFQVAAIRSLDPVTGDPSAYYKADTAVGGNGSIGGSYSNTGNPYIASYSSTGASYISPGTSSNMIYHILRKNPADARLLLMTDNSSQGRDGVLFTLSALSVPNNTRIYGYSIFGMDVNANPAANLVDYSNTTNFPTNSNYNNGGLDEVAITGIAITNPVFVVLAEYLEDFEATPSGRQVQLNWQLYSSARLKEVVMTRSSDGTNFSPLQTFLFPSAGWQTTTDDQPLPGKSYYRLNLQDNDGNTIAYSPVRSVIFNGPLKPFLTIYPNPVRNRQLGIAAGGLTNDRYPVRIMDMNGKLILTGALESSSNFRKDILLPEGLPAGVYTLQLLDGNGNKMLSRSMILE